MSISGKNDIDWKTFASALGAIETQDTPAIVKKKSRDFFWYSPVLNRQLRHSFGDLVALPQNVDELKTCLRAAHAWQVPIVLRGGGTGNYGQAVPLEGGLIIDMTRLDGILEIGPDFVRVEAGARIRMINDALKANGRELPVFPSTQEIATIGGFVAGGSGGIGSIEHGMLRDEGNLISLSAISVEAEPGTHEFTGADVNLIHHAWGTNGVISEITLRTVPKRDWINCIASYGAYRQAYAAGIEVSHAPDIAPKLLTTVSAEIAPYFSELEEHIAGERHLLLALVAREELSFFRDRIIASGGTLELTLDEHEIAAAGLPHVFEFSYNHTTLQALKKDRTVTYLQVFNPAPLTPETIDILEPVLGEDVLMHHEFARLNSEIVAFDLPLVRYSNDQRLYEIIDTYERHGFPVSDPHTYLLEDGGVKRTDYRHLAWKRRLDPDGLLNPGKLRSWEKLKHLTPEEIELLA